MTDKKLLVEDVMWSDETEFPVKTSIALTDKLVGLNSEVDPVDNTAWEFSTLKDDIKSSEVVQTWDGSTTPVNVTAGSGIDITDGIISLDGTGASAASGYISVVNYSTVISYTDTTTWKALVGDIRFSLIDNFQTGNDTPSDPTTPFFLQYVGTESGVFEFNCSFSMRRFSSTAANGYYLSASHTGNSPLDPALGNRQIDFGLNGQGTVNSKSISYTVQILLNTNDKIWFVVNNWGPSTSATDNDFLATECLVSAKKIGDVGGSNSGVVSLGGKDGIIGIGGTLTYSGDTLITTALSGDITTLDDSFVTLISNDAVTNSKIANSTIDLTTKVTGVLPVTNGGTNNTTYLTSSVIYFDGTKLTNSSHLSWNGTNAINFSNAANVMALSIINSQDNGTPNDAHLMISRANTDFGTAHIKYQDSGTPIWTVGMFPGDSAFYFHDVVNNLNCLAIEQNGNVKLPQLTASLPVFTDASKNLTNTGTVPFSKGGFGFTTATLGDIFYASAANTPGKLAAVAAGSVLTSNGTGSAPQWSTFPTISRIALTNGSVPISGINSIIDISSAASDGTYLSLGGSGRNIGQVSGGNLFFTNNLNYNASVNSFFYAANNSAMSIEIGATSGTLKYAASGNAGDPVTPSTALGWDSSGNINIPGLSASQLVVSDGSKNLISGGPIPSGFTNFVTSNSSSVSVSTKTVYYNTYASGQATFNLPAATGSNSIVAVMGIAGASVSGWKIQANGVDTIQAASLVSSAGGTLLSTTGSAIDQVFLFDYAAGKWISFSILGSNLTVT